MSSSKLLFLDAIYIFQMTLKFKIASLGINDLFPELKSLYPLPAMYPHMDV